MYPDWATPLDVARTHDIYVCECDNHFPAIAEVEVVITRKVQLGMSRAEYDRRARLKRGERVHTDAEARRYEIVMHRICYRLCAVCLVREREIRGEVSYHTAQRAVEALERAYYAAECDCTSRRATTLNNAAARAHSKRAAA